MPVDSQGLSDAEVEARVARGEVNRVVSPVSRTLAQIVRANVFTRFNAILGTLCAVILLTGPWQDALFGGVLVANALIGIVQEVRAKWALDRLAVVSQPKARVLRAGRIVELPAEQIVLDDIIEPVTGDQVMVDGTILDAFGFEIDESLLSGESEPVVKRPGDTVLSGSFVVAGTGRCHVTRVGTATHAYRLAQEAKRFSLAHSELRTGIDRILRYVTWAIVPTALLLFASQFALQSSMTAGILFAAGGVVAMVPEGLVLLTSLALAMGAIRLVRRHTLVQDLPATETLARVDVVCFDKTGTLTEPEPQLERVEWLGDPQLAARALAALAAAEPNPNATLRAIRSAYPDTPPIAITTLVSFSSSRKWSGATFDEFGSWVLGAPEVLLAQRQDYATLLERIEAQARSGRRVLLLARSQTVLTAEQLPQDLIPVSFILLVEQMRADATETLRYFAAQGIALKVISGDHPETVGLVAERAGLGSAADSVDARVLPQDTAALGELVRTRSVFGRISPQQKQAVVAALQANGHTVAMVGDGVNDVLALKQADVGIAMGAGAGAARAVAQLVLLDNRFASLPAVIAEGRRVIGNVERVAALFLTKTVYAMLLAFAVGVVDVTFPFLPRHLTLVGSMTIGIPAFLFSLQPNAERARPDFVGRVLRFAIPSGLWVAVVTFAGYILAHGYWGANLAGARTAATIILTAVALGVLALVGQPLDLVRRLIVIGMMAAFAAVLAIPWLRSFFALEALPLTLWFALACTAAGAIIALHWSTALTINLPPKPMKTRPLNKKEALTWLLGLESPKWFLAGAAVLVLGGAWLFFGVLEDVVSHDPLVVVDANVYQLLQSFRAPWLDTLMIAVTELGDPQVLLAVILVALVWFVAHRLWLTTGYWLAAIGLAELLEKLLKLTLHRPRPGVMYEGIEQYSFPSGHATMNAVVYGWLAFLLCRDAQGRMRTAVALVSGTLVMLIALSRLYLGAHWLSDVVGGLAFGMAWVAALAIVYTYQSHEHVQPRKFMAALLLTFVLAGSVHVAFSHDSDVQRYAPSQLFSRISARFI